jgi:hypothetical protein
MAKRESQGLQIALIVFVMVTVVFMVLTVLFWKKSENAVADAKDKETQLQTARTELRTKNEDLESLKQLLGYAADAATADVSAAFDKDMALYARALPEDQRNYRNLPKHLNDALVSKSTALVQASDENRRLQAEMESRIQQEVAKRDAAVKAQQTSEETLASERSKFNEQLSKLNADRDKDMNLHREQRAKLEEEIKRSEQLAATSKRDLDRLKVRYDLLLVEINEARRETLEVPDGSVLATDQRSRLVTIDLGRADAVREQMTFDVYEVDENNLARSRPKGKVEVVRVGLRTSDAEILEDELSNPIVTGDVIHSRIWERGSPVRFALAGLMDLDRDGRSDRELVRSLIELRGGVVDAEVTDKGEVKGEVTVHTRYMVLGDPPTDPNVLAAYTELLTQAANQGVEQKSITEILGYLHYSRDRGTVPLGKAARPADFAPKPYEGAYRRTSKGSVSELYKTERPPFRASRK